MLIGIGLAVAVLLWLTAVPLAVLLLTAVSEPGVYGLRLSTPTLENFRQLFAQNDLPRLLTNTASYVGGTIALATVFALTWAWITERTDFKYKTLIRVLMTLVMGLPPLVQGFGWTLLLNPNNGWINHLLRGAFGFEAPGPIDIYSMSMMVFVSAFLLTPTVYLMLSGVIRNLDAKLEFPAVLAGVPPLTMVMRIAAPVLLPGLLAVLIYTVMIMIQVFDIPLAIGLTAGVQVLSTRIYLLSSPELGTPNYNLAAAFGVFLTAIAVALVLVYRRLTRLSERFSIVSGKQYRQVRTELGSRRWIVYAFVIAFFAVSLAPVAILGWASLFPYYRLPSLSALQSVSLANYEQLFTSSLFWTGARNTLVVVLVGSTVAVLLSFGISYVALRTRGLLGSLVDVLAFLPIAVPHIVLAVAVLLLYVRTPVYGTIAAIILAQIGVNMVFGVRTMSAAMVQVHADLERAAVICGAGRMTVLLRILMPILRPQLLNAWLFIFAHAMRDLAIPLVFLTTQTVVLSSALWLLWGYPNITGASALSMVIVAVLLVIVTPLQVYATRVDRRMNPA